MDRHPVWETAFNRDIQDSQDSPDARRSPSYISCASLLAVLALTSAAPRAFAQAIDLRVATEEASAEDAPAEKASTEEAPAPLPPEQLSPEEEATILRDAERIVLSADLVIEGESDRFPRYSPRAEFRVTESFKGQAESKGPLTVDLAKAPVGLWPREGERKILCLAAPETGRSGEGVWQLAAYHASILPSTDTAREAIRGWLGLKQPAAAEETEAGLYAEYIAEAEAILVGVLSNIERFDVEGPPGEAEAEGVFRLDEKGAALLGYDGYRTPITVRFAPEEEAPGVQPDTGGVGGKLPGAGRYLLFLKGSTDGPGFESIHRVALADAEAESELRREVLRGIGPDRGTLTAIQSTLAEWQDAWNTRDLGRCVRCYSAENRSRRLYEAGGEDRKDLEEQIGKFASTVMVSLQRVSTTEDTETGRVEAEATLVIELTVSGKQDRRTTKMTFLREEGEWLILEEGL